MKNLLIIIGIVATSGVIAEAANRSCRLPSISNCCQTANDNCPSTACGSTRWYKAKDGTLREMMSYKDALSRAEDADDVEHRMKEVQEQLVAAKASIETVQADAATLKSSMESQLAALQQQLDTERQAVAAQKERGDKAEAAHKQSIEQIAALRETSKKSEDLLNAAQAKLKETAQERDSLKAAKAELEQKLSDMSAARAAAEDAAKVSQQELEKQKLDAAEGKKSVIETDEKAQNSPEPDTEKPVADGGAATGEELSSN
jgi:chromosome segregation protein